MRNIIQTEIQRNNFTMVLSVSIIISLNNLLRSFRPKLLIYSRLIYRYHCKVTKLKDQIESKTMLSLLLIKTVLLSKFVAYYVSYFLVNVLSSSVSKLCYLHGRINWTDTLKRHSSFKLTLSRNEFILIGVLNILVKSFG